MSYEDLKDLARRITFDKVLHDKVFDVAANPKYDGYQEGISFMKSSQVVVLSKTNNQLKNYTSQLFIKFETREVYSSFEDNIWDTDLRDMCMSINQLTQLMNTIPRVTKPPKIKHVNTTSSTSNDFHKENYKKDSKFEVGDHVKISNFKTNFSKVQARNQSKDVFAIKKSKKCCSMDMCIKRPSWWQNCCKVL